MKFLQLLDIGLVLGPKLSQVLVKLAKYAEYRIRVFTTVLLLSIII